MLLLNKIRMMVTLTASLGPVMIRDIKASGIHGPHVRAKGKKYHFRIGTMCTKSKCSIIINRIMEMT